ncbi:hypothetical protein MIND_00605700 [Mycena indigotica]|uniref:Uncharacterized protein n=1 Tax=Mycena indigotica TaxID=2126181 RepID=A0A8H6SS90_9AGAR|nr:uncharacterized protein MIND_00605700 [Mycena indigotica]KAF7303761.1 hypothetical protein MIND_00605700 [Mycena indigotica]
MDSMTNQALNAFATLELVEALAEPATRPGRGRARLPRSRANQHLSSFVLHVPPPTQAGSSVALRVKRGRKPFQDVQPSSNNTIHSPNRRTQAGLDAYPPTPSFLLSPSRRIHDQRSGRPAPYPRVSLRIRGVYYPVEELLARHIAPSVDANAENRPIADNLNSIQ